MRRLELMSACHLPLTTAPRRLGRLGIPAAPF